MKNKKIFIAFFLMTLVIIISSCADVTNVDNCTADIEPYGFWYGLWHGMISWFSFFGSLLSDDIALYAVNNNGGWYDFGFVLGAGILGGGTAKATESKPNSTLPTGDPVGINSRSNATKLVDIW